MDSIVHSPVRKLVEYKYYVVILFFYFLLFIYLLTYLLFFFWQYWGLNSGPTP
jgi:hypothetical protein